jgi:hypothetical protein
MEEKNINIGYKNISYSLPNSYSKYSSLLENLLEQNKQKLNINITIFEKFKWTPIAIQMINLYYHDNNSVDLNKFPIDILCESLVVVGYLQFTGLEIYITKFISNVLQSNIIDNNIEKVHSLLDSMIDVLNDHHQTLHLLLNESCIYLEHALQRNLIKDPVLAKLNNVIKNYVDDVKQDDYKCSNFNVLKWNKNIYLEGYSYMGEYFDNPEYEESDPSYKMKGKKYDENICFFKQDYEDWLYKCKINRLERNYQYEKFLMDQYHLQMNKKWEKKQIHRIYCYSYQNIFIIICWRVGPHDDEYAEVCTQSLLIYDNDKIMQTGSTECFFVWTPNGRLGFDSECVDYLWEQCGKDSEKTPDIELQKNKIISEDECKLFNKIYKTCDSLTCKGDTISFLQIDFDQTLGNAFIPKLICNLYDLSYYDLWKEQQEEFKKTGKHWEDKKCEYTYVTTKDDSNTDNNSDCSIFSDFNSDSDSDNDSNDQQKDKYSVLSYSEDETIDGICDENNVDHDSKNKYYLLKKSEKVSSKKNIVLYDTNNKQFIDIDCRKVLGVSTSGDITLNPKNITSQYQVYIQSTSSSRKIPKNTNILIENEQSGGSSKTKSSVIVPAPKKGAKRKG